MPVSNLSKAILWILVLALTILEHAQEVPARTLVWTGVTNGAALSLWDVGVSNWVDSATGLPAAYSESGGVGDAVFFGDHASNAAVMPWGIVRPSSIVFSNQALGYMLTGSGGVGGSGKLLKSGAGVVTLACSNSYTGGGGGGARAKLLKSGAGVVTLACSNSYTGGTSNLAGALEAGNDSGLGSGLVAMGGGSLRSDSSASRMLGNPFQIMTASTFGDAVNSGTLYLNGGIDFGGGTRNLTLQSDLVLGGNLANGGINRKLGPAALVLSGTGTLTGNIELRQGSFVLDGALIDKPAGGFRIMGTDTNGLVRAVVTNGALLSFSGSSQNVRVGSTNPDGHPSATNILDIWAAVEFPAGYPSGNLQMGASSARAEVNLWPGGLIAVRSVVHQGNTTEFNFRGGTLRAVTGTASFMGGLSAVYVRDGGAVIDSAGFDIGISQSLLDGGGGGGLRKTGAGSLMLAGTNTYRGATVVESGQLGMPTGGLLGNGPLELAGGASLRLQSSLPASLETSELRLGGSGAVGLSFDYGFLAANPSAPMVIVAGDIVVGANEVTVNIGGAGFQEGQFPLMQYGSGLQGNGFQAFRLGAVPAYMQAALINNTNNFTIDLQVSSVSVTSTLPNLLLIVSDDAGYHDFSMHGGTNFPTPRIDRLASEGVRFRAGYTSGAVCSPTRAGIMTGRYQHRFGHDSNPTVPGNRGLSTNETTTAQHLKALGYTTACIGKWHLGDKAQYHPNRRGFDIFYGFLGGARSYFPLSAPAAHQVVQSNGVPTPEGGYTTDRFGQAAANFIRAHAGQPWFLYLTFNAVHTPMHADTARLNALTNYSYETDNRRTQAAMTLALDENVGLVLDTLQALNLSSNTLVAFVNDNGGSAANPTDNTPLRDFKGSLYEGGIRIPYILRWPGKIPAGQLSDEPVITLDLLPTFLAAAGAAEPTNRPLDGVNLLQFAMGETNRLPREALFWRTGGSTAGQSAVRRGQWKLHRLDATGQTELYRLNPDGTGEYSNLATNNAQTVLELMALFDEWESQTAAPFWGNGSVLTINNPWVDSSDLGYLLDGTSNALSHALLKLRDPLTWDTDFSIRWEIETNEGGTNQNGYMVFGSGAAEQSLFRVGIERNPDRLIMAEPGTGLPGELAGLNLPIGRLELELSFSCDQRALLLRCGTNVLQRVLIAEYEPLTHIGYAVKSTQTRFSRFEIVPRTRLLLYDPAIAGNPGIRFKTKISRQTPASLVMERSVGLAGPSTPLTNQPVRFLGGRLFEFEDLSAGENAGFYRMHSAP